MTREAELLQKLVDIEIEKEKVRLENKKSLSKIKRLLIFIVASYILYYPIVDLIVYMIIQKETNARGF